MTNGERPTITGMNYATALGTASSTFIGGGDRRRFLEGLEGDREAALEAIARRVPGEFYQQLHHQPEKLPMNATNRRLVKVFIADPDENVPLDHCMLFKGEEQVTDLTDQELYFELDIAGLLSAHNKYRAGLPDKKASRDKPAPVMLEPIRVRDLKMVVVSLAAL